MADILVKMARGDRPRRPRSFRRRGPLAPPRAAGVPGVRYDPHVWFDVTCHGRRRSRRWSTRSRRWTRLAKALYEENGKRYRKALDELHAYCKKQLATVLAAQRVLVTVTTPWLLRPGAWVKVIGLQGISTVSEASLRDIERLVDLIVSSGVKSVFVESSVSTRNIEAVVQGCKREPPGEDRRDPLLGRHGPGRHARGAPTSAWSG